MTCSVSDLCEGPLLPGPKAILAGPTFDEWLEANVTASHAPSAVARHE